jgi:hypothetical protein
VFTLFGHTGGIRLVSISAGLLAGLTFPASTGYETNGNQNKGSRANQFPLNLLSNLLAFHLSTAL